MGSWDSIEHPPQRGDSAAAGETICAASQRGWGFTQLRFEVQQGSDQIFLTAPQQSWGPWVLQKMVLDIPQETPFSNASSWVNASSCERLRGCRGVMHELSLSLSNAGFTQLLEEMPLQAHGFSSLRGILHNGFVQIAGLWTVAHLSAPFTCRITWVAYPSPAPQALRAIFYDPRLYGWLPQPAAFLPYRLGQAVQSSLRGLQRAHQWMVWPGKVHPVETWVRQALPASGWKIPDMEKIQQVKLSIHPDGMHVTASSSDERATLEDLRTSALPVEAVQALQGMAACASFEKEGRDGAPQAAAHAYEASAAAVMEGRGGAWACQRLLQFGAADPILSCQTYRLAHTCLSYRIHVLSAHLALGALARRMGQGSDASRHYQAVAALVAQQGQGSANLDMWAVKAALDHAMVDPTLQAKNPLSYATLAPDATRRAACYGAVAATYLQRLGNVEKSQQALAKACAAAPQERKWWQSLADTHTGQKASYPRAFALYQKLLTSFPTDVTLLRRAARLAARMGEMDRAYGYHACLYHLLPADAEAREWVMAFRKQRPDAPKRPLTLSERGLSGVQHPHQAGPLEDLFVPLARFAELCVAELCEGERCAQDATHLPILSKQAILSKPDPFVEGVFNALGGPRMPWYEDPHQPTACHVVLLKDPILKIGSYFKTPSHPRLRAFVSARALALHATGHTLCERLSSVELQALLEALKQALQLDLTKPAYKASARKQAAALGLPSKNPDTHIPQGMDLIQKRILDTILRRLSWLSRPMQLVMQPYVHACASPLSLSDVARWKEASICTAQRVALVISCDVEEALKALRCLQSPHGGFDTFSDLGSDLGSGLGFEQLQKDAHALDLFCFAQSEAYLQLRARLGLAS